ncbi:MAG: hypothetical protein IJY07_04710 [Clostridia bacterium]|nr:hypothetical protein [Clostridia bacterium]
MKLFDDIVVLNDNYAHLGVKKGARGAIIKGEIRSNKFLVEFFDLEDDDMPIYGIKIYDMEVTQESNISDQAILNDLPLKNPKWWCKVEDGYIYNLLGERKNTIPYDYDS